MTRRRAWIRTLALGGWTACATPGVDLERVPLCESLEALAPLPDPETCGEQELAPLSAALADAVLPYAGDALVRAELDGASKVGGLCVQSAPGYAPSRARRALAERLDGILALPPGPACAAGTRIDLNRYEAKWAEISNRRARCSEQTRVTRETHGPTTVRDRTVPGAYGVFERELEWCMEHEADWIVLDEPGSTRPRIYVKPEVPDPPGPSAQDTRSRCFRTSNLDEKRAACIESEGWERLEPPPR